VELKVLQHDPDGEVQAYDPRDNSRTIWKRKLRVLDHHFVATFYSRDEWRLFFVLQTVQLLCCAKKVVF
jgi:hypothetical protein